MLNRILLSLKLILWFIFTHAQVPSNVSYALEIAGENKNELIKVINHYISTDSPLKLKAAYYLIGNMPGHYSSNQSPIDYFDHYFIEAGESTDKEYRRYLMDSLKKEGITPQIQPYYFYDIHAISSEYLINNIEISFKIWENAPWANQYSFDQFCEYILPYKVNEGMPLENWKEIFHEQNMHYLDTSQNAPFEDTYGQMFYEINKGFRNMTGSFYPGPISLKNLNTGKIGLCSDGCNYFAAMTRSIGLPTTVDFTPQWGNFRLGHEFNSLHTPDSIVKTNLYLEKEPLKYGHYVHAMRYFNDGTLLTYKKEKHNKWLKEEILDRNIFEITNVSTRNVPKNLTIHSEKKVAKVFRQTYAIQSESLILYEKDHELIPPQLQQIHNQDVTHEYVPTSTVKLNIDRTKDQKYVFLCVFIKDGYYPMSGAIIDENNNAVFKNMGLDVLYFPMYYETGKYVPAEQPFVLQQNGEKQFFNTENETAITVKIDRKFLMPLRMVYYSTKMIGGMIQVSNDPSFSDYKTIKTIKKGPYYWADYEVSTRKKYRYARLYNQDNKGDIAELEFYTKTGVQYLKLSGDIIHSDTKFVYPRSRAFDGDMNSYIDNKETGNWIGLDFGKSVSIDKVRYCPRNDTNQIIPGQIYELCYWNNGWQPVGRKTATDAYISFDQVPKDGLYWLRNLSGGNEERPFVFQDGKQIFY